MASHTQFQDLFEQRVAALTGSRASPRQKRWAIWLRQDREQQRICFSTSARDTCLDRRCPHRKQCVNLQAEWLR